ncbi:hypothetical protein pb186bvf_019806 [Paramecium bursaria]
MIVGQKIEGYTIIQQIGQGNYGEVYLAYKDNQNYAMKRINKFKLKQNNGIVNQLVNNEINALRIIENDNVVRLIEELDHKDFKSIIMEYCEGGDLQEFVTSKKHLEENEALSYFKQILNGMFGLHEKRVIHRDLKPSNILLHKKTILKIADLGFCKQFDNLGDQSTLVLGSFGFMAPEIAQQQKYGIAADMFSLGCILYFMLFGALPFKVGNHHIYLQSLNENNVNYQLNGIRISQPVEQLLRSTLEIDPNRRIQFSKIYESGLLKQQVDLTKTGIERCLLGGNMLNKNIIQKNINFYQSNPNIELMPPNDLEDARFIKQITNITTVDQIELDQLNNQNVKDILTIGINKYNNYLYIFKTYQYMHDLKMNDNDKKLQFLLLIMVKNQLQQLPVLFQKYLDITKTLVITEMYRVHEYILMLDEISNFQKKVDGQIQIQNFQGEMQFQDGIQIIEQYNKNLKAQYKSKWQENKQYLILALYLQNSSSHIKLRSCIT